MSKKYLLLDFGASRIKSAIYKNGKFTNIFEIPSLNPINLDKNKFEISSIELRDVFCNIVKKQYSETMFDAIFICSEMHGFMLVDENNTPLSNYISWKDERCINSENINEYEILKNEISTSFLETTGMKFRPCYPITKINSLANDLEIKDFKIITLPEWLSCCSNRSLNISNITMGAGLGFYNIKNYCWEKKYLDFFDNLNISFNKITDKIEISGYFKLDTKNYIPIYTGIGDLQAAIIGAGYGTNIVNLNLGTGSQVVNFLEKIENQTTELRPFLDDKFLSVITHIPSGRALNAYVKFLESINPNKNFWGIIDKLGIEDLNKSSLDINLGVFASAWNFSGSGYINNILENNFNENNFIASLVKSYLKQYDLSIQELLFNKPFDKIILSGGIANKVPIIKKYFEKKYKNCKIELFNSNYDTTLLGLSYLADKE